MNLAQVAPTPNAVELTSENHVRPVSTHKESSVNEKHANVQFTLWRQTLNLGRRLFAGYSKLQVSYRGMYSIERLQAFQVYCEKTSTTRAIAVCVLTPVPSLLAMMLIECIPLRDPDLGWRANYMFWFRFFVSGVIIMIGSTYQVTDMLEHVEISAFQSLRMAIISMAIYVATVLGIAALWVFPVPFGIVVGIGPCYIIFLVALVFTIGTNSFRECPGLGHELRIQLYVLATEATIAVIYPAFSSIYLKASPNSRAGLVVLLPLTKLVMKNIVAWASSHLEDYVPLIAVFSIEVFNALYVATCMQTTKSSLATIVIISIDVINGALSFYSLLGRTRVIQEQHLQPIVFTEGASGELVTVVASASLQLRVFHTKEGKMIRIRSPLKLNIGSEVERILESLLEHQVKCLNHGLQETPRTTSRSPVTIHPISESQSLIGQFEPQALKQTKSHHSPLEEQRVALVESTLALLFHCEYRALVEYVECAIPVLFGIYVTALCQLPTHKYYPHTRDMIPGQLEEMLKSLLVYVGLEILSFLMLHMALKQKFNLSALYQLAFVLETHAVQLQSRLFVWIVFILQFTLQHYGVDFTFQFAWLK